MYPYTFKLMQDTFMCFIAQLIELGSKYFLEWIFDS